MDSDAFARDVCPRYFRHSKWTSFSRMLNMYEFRKVSTSPRNARSTRHEFAHEFFTRDRKDLLNRVQRKWVYLEPIFGRGALPHEQDRFNRVNSEYRLLMRNVGAAKCVSRASDFRGPGSAHIR